MTPGHPQTHAQNNIHATGLVLGGAGVMVRGRSGSGKSLLALALLDRADGRGEAALLVSDDRIVLTRGEHCLYMQAPPGIAGLIELRGRGIVARPSAERAEVHLIVDLVEDFTRMVEEDELATTVLGIPLPRCPVPRRGVIDAAHQLALVVEALRELGANPPGAAKIPLETPHGR